MIDSNNNDLNVYGSKATSRGVVKHTHKPKAIMTKSQYIRNLELKGMTLVRGIQLVIV